MGNQAKYSVIRGKIQLFVGRLRLPEAHFCIYRLEILREYGYYIGKSPSKILKRSKLVAMGNQAKYSVTRGKIQLFMGRLGLPEAYLCSYRLEIFREHGYDIS